MTREPNVTGRWVGNYFQHGRPQSIVADLVQAHQRLTGSMRDRETDFEYSITEWANEAGLPPGGDEQIVDRLRLMFPDAPATPIRYVMHLPPDSELEGWVKGPEVSFLKFYMGDQYGGYLIGDSVVGFQHAAHVVHYTGRLSTDGEAIEGRWWIDPTPGRGARRTEGSFTLRRQEGADCSSEAITPHSAEHDRRSGRLR
jgi:hypothetical protein